MKFEQEFFLIPKETVLQIFELGDKVGQSISAEDRKEKTYRSNILMKEIWFKGRNYQDYFKMIQGLEEEGKLSSINFNLNVE